MRMSALRRCLQRPVWVNEMKRNVDNRGPSTGKVPTPKVFEASWESGKHDRSRAKVPPDDIRKSAKLKMVEKRRDRSRSISMSIFVLIVMLLTVLLILNIMKRNAPKPQFMFIQTGTIEHSLTADALIIREENILSAPDNGYLKPIVQSGSRVSFGQTAAVILREGSEEALATLKNYDQQIADLQMALVLQGKGTGAQAIYTEADESIANQIDLVRRDASGMTFPSFGSYRTSIDVAMSRRDSRLSAIDFKDAALKELKSQKAGLEKSLGIVAGNVVVGKPGILSYSIDGLEGRLSPATVDKMGLDQFKEFAAEVPTLLTADQYREKGADAVKIITGIYQYIALILPESADGSFPEESRHTIQIPSTGTSIDNCLLYRKIIQSGELLVIFRTDRQIVRFADMRHVKVQLSVLKTEGLRIPFSSVMNLREDGTVGDIMLVVSGYARKMPVRLVDSDSEYVIIEAVAAEDQATLDKGYLVKNPDSVTEGENLGG
jgi:hypothetical protein